LQLNDESKDRLETLRRAKGYNVLLESKRAITRIEMAVEWWVVLATLAGPVIAVKTQKWIERATERRRTRVRIFHTLISNRATRLNEEFIRASNIIDLEFMPGRFFVRKDRAVIHAWRLFGEFVEKIGDGATEEDWKAWNRRIDNLLVALLKAMAEALGYAFSEEELRRGIYYPQGRVDLEQSQMAVLRGVRMALGGKLAIPMKITEFPNSPELLAAQIDMVQKSARSYSEDGALKVRMQVAEHRS
jgi:hypothetical protein